MSARTQPGRRSCITACGSSISSLPLRLFIALETQAATFPHIRLVHTFLEYRRIKGTLIRETTDYISDEETPENRIVPDGAFILENIDSSRRALFFVELDTGNEQVAATVSADRRATLKLKFTQYDRYLT